MENVTVKAFSSQDVVGSTSESVGYYRSWNLERAGGEIGRIFFLPYTEYIIDVVRFKVSNMCDTCSIRLHIRNVRYGFPDKELLPDTMVITIHKHLLDDKAPVFDLRNKPLKFTESAIYVGLEVLDCHSSLQPDCYFSFAGTDKGQYIFKQKDNMFWQSSKDEYGIYVKLFVRY